MSAKDLILKPIEARVANEFIRKHHYSGKHAPTSCLQIGVFWHGSLEGVMQFGSPVCKEKIQRLVKDSGWNEFVELNRLAFSEVLPRNSESRALSIVFKLFKKYAPHIKWIVSFADACQCGDGTIYRASGFILTDIKENRELIKMPDGRVIHLMNLQDSVERVRTDKERYSKPPGVSARKWASSIGAKPVKGYQLRYIYFLNPSYRSCLIPEEIPYERIQELGASMYKGLRS